jgi:hypothetical protein
VDHVTIVLEQVHLLNGRNVSAVKSVEGGFETFIIMRDVFSDGFVFSSDRAFATGSRFGLAALRLCHQFC